MNNSTLEQRIQSELFYHTISFRDIDSVWFEGIDINDFDNLTKNLMNIFKEFKKK